MNKDNFYINDLSPIREFCINSDKEDVYKYIYCLQQENQELKKQLGDTIKSYTYENNLRHEIDLKLDIAKKQDEAYKKFMFYKNLNKALQNEKEG